jgi:23S rRNA pseudouridine2605 synthase
MSQERLQKALAHAGVGSRRGCETMIRRGRVTVNGTRAVIGQQIDTGKDQVRVDGKKIKFTVKRIYLMLNKPIGVLSSRESQGGYPTVIDLIDSRERLFPVGRLDLESEGLILLTNDGELTQKMTHPRFGHEKEYKVTLDRVPDEKQLRTWRRGVVLESGQRTQPVRVHLEAGPKGQPGVRVIMTQGIKRQIRETALSLGLRVRKLIRVRIGSLHLGNLGKGKWRELTRTEINALLKEAARKDKN